MALPQIQSAIHELGLEGSDIRLQGCAVAQFSVQSLAISAALPTYRVYYPDVPDFEASDYLPPLVHELAHILQLKQAGGLEALKAKFTSEQIELGADFLAGLIAGRHRIFDPVDFHANLNVVGHYRQSSNEHGSPERRTASFQFGVYHDENSSIGGVADAYAYFQDVLYADLPREARARNRS